METRLERSFVRTYLPWLVALGALLIYAVTLNRALSLTSVVGLARVAGWDWHPVAQAPLFYLLTYPIRWLPNEWQLTVGSMFSMGCAILALALLARSVSLLPHDRTREQRMMELGEQGLLEVRLSWIAPLLAVLVCGLQLSFWEQATAASGEMLDLLIFAYVIRCLLEYRVDGREWWMAKMAFVYGLGTANNWVMIAFFPGFLIAVVWIMGLGFFRYRFLVRTTLCGLAGLLLYAILPLVNIWSDPVHGDFWDSLHTILITQKNTLALFRPYLLVLLSLGSFLPLFIISIRWPNSMGDISAAGYAAATFMLYVLYAAFFAICIYNAFDPPISPRRLTYGWGFAMLPFYYLGAICIGYFSGFFLLIFGGGVNRMREKIMPTQKMLNLAVTAVVLVASVAVPIGLAIKNVPEILARNSGELETYAKRLAGFLPATGSVVLSDDPVRLYAVRAALGSRADKFVLLDTTALQFRDYHRFLKHKYGTRLPEPPVSDPESPTIPIPSLVDYMVRAAGQAPLYYLHPSFGYYFERFYQVPIGLVYQMKLLPANAVEIPRVAAQTLQEQAKLWADLEKGELSGLKAKVERLQRVQKGEITSLWVASYYSRALNWWGVQLLQDQQTDKAMSAFQWAADLNSFNACAFVNLEWARHWKETGKLLDRFSPEVMEKLGPYAGNWDLLMTLNGPLDEPTFRMELARMMVQRGLSAQAAQLAQRVMDINPKDLDAALILGNALIQAGLPDRALQLVSKIRTDPDLNPKESQRQVDVISIEAWAAYAKNEQAKAEGILLAAQEKHPQADGAFFAMAQMYLASAERDRAAGKQAEFLKGMTNAMRVFEKQIKLQPANSLAMVNYGGICAQLEDFPRALTALTRAVEMDLSSQGARLNRAIVNLRMGKDEQARLDYEYLLKLSPASYRAYYGLAELACRKSNWYEALNNYELYLRHAPPNTPEYVFVQNRLPELKKKAKQ